MKKYQTQSLYESSFLLSSGFPIVSKDNHGEKVTLVFEETSELKQAVMSFYNGSGNVSAKSFVDNFRSLKDFIFQGRGY